MIFKPEPELVDYFFRQEFGVADVLDLHPTHHLTDDHFQMLVVDVHALQTVDFLDLVHQVFLQLLLAEHGQNVVRIAGAIHERLAFLDSLALLYVDVYAARQRIFALFAIVADDVDLALTLADLAVFHRAFDLGDDSGFPRLSRLEQLDHAGETTGNVLGLSGFTRDLRQYVGRVDFVTVPHHQVGVGRHEVLLRLARPTLGLHDNCRLPLLVDGVGHHQLRHTGHLVDALLNRSTFNQIFEVDHAADFGQNRERVGIPLEQDLVG